jgi:hypothetical protein
MQLITLRFLVQFPRSEAGIQIAEPGNSNPSSPFCVSWLLSESSTRGAKTNPKQCNQHNRQVLHAAQGEYRPV